MCRARSAATGCGRSGVRRRAARDAGRDRVGTAQGVVGIAVEHFWQNFPKAIEAGSRTPDACVCCRGSSPTCTSCRAASRRRTRFTLAFGDDPIGARRAVLGPRAVDRRGDAAWYCSAPRRCRTCRRRADDADDRLSAAGRRRHRRRRLVRRASARRSTNTAGATSATSTPITRTRSAASRAARLALQQSVRRDRRVRLPVPAHRRRPLVAR